MVWEKTAPAAGSMIRVESGSIHHYGVYVSDDEIIQFGLAPILRPHQKDSDVAVLSTDLADFLNGGVCETAVFTPEEAAEHPTPAEAVSSARGRMGERGYHILYNNCEHFANECVTGKHCSAQVDGVREMFKELFAKKTEPFDP
jgi:hypothetical protein